jgi:hypothetical protein
MGRLVHELLHRTVDHLEPKPGFTVAARHEIEEALAIASSHVIESWPLVTNVPPPVLWINTVRQAAEMSLAGLTFETFTEAGTSSWTEVPFGGEVPEDPPVSLPWDPTRPVVVPGTDIHIRGKIDRLDLRASAVAVRVTDYKTGQRPKVPDQMNIDGGTELQRVLYSLACRQLLPETKALIAAAEQYVQKTAPQRAHQSRPRDVPPETLQSGARTLRPAGGVTIGEHCGVHRPGRSARDAVDLQPGLLDQPIQSAPGKGTMRAAALQRKVDEQGDRDRDFSALVVAIGIVLFGT